MNSIVRAAIDKAILFLAAIAPLTPIKSDDALVVLLKAIQADAELLGYVEAKADADAAGTLQIEGEPPVALQLALERQGLKWADFAAALPVILEIIRLARRG